MGEAFFTEVTGPDPVRRPRLDEPARLQGLRAGPHRPRQADGGPPPDRRLPLALVRLARPDMFGVGTLDRPWLDPAADPMAGRAARRWRSRSSSSRSSASPYYCFHDRDVAPEGDDASREFRDEPRRARRRRRWATRSGPASGCCGARPTCSRHPRYQAGAATNPDPEVFAYAAAQVKHMLEVTQRLGGANYVLWGGREGYDTLLNTDLKREGDQLARFLHLVAEHKHQIGFEGTLLIEPKPMEPTKHQYDYDVATVHGFLVRNGLEDEYRVNIEANHATLAGHSFHHEVAYAVANGILGSIDANRGDPQNGWDTDQFPNSVEDLALPIYEILRGGGFTTGGFNFDAKLRRQSTDRTDLFHAHIGGIDTLARALLVAADLLERGDARATARGERYAAGTARSGAAILDGRRDRSRRSRRGSRRGEIDPRPVSGRQERLENLVNQSIWAAGPPRRVGDGAPGADRRGLRPRDRRLDDRDEGRPRSTSRARSSASASSEYGFDVPQPLLERAGPGAVVGRRGRGDPVRPGVDGRRRRRRRRRRADRPDARARPARRRRRASSARRSSGTTSGRPPSATRSARRSGRSGSIAITGNDALTGFTAPKLVWVRDHEPEVWARVAHVLLPEGLRPAAADRRARHRQGRRRRDAPVRPRGPRLVAGGARRARDRPGVAAADVRGPGRHRARHGARRRRRPGCAPGRRSSPAAATRPRTRSASGRSSPGRSRSRSARPGVDLRRDRRSRSSSRDGRVHAFCHAVPDRWHLMSVMLSAAGSLRWFRDALAPGVRRSRPSSTAAAEVPPGSDGLLFLPYLTGERSPHPDPLARGAFVGLTVGHDRRHLTRAVLEGVAFGLRDGLDLMVAAGMPAPAQIRASGGGTASPLWRQILADVLGRRDRDRQHDRGRRLTARPCSRPSGPAGSPTVEAAASAWVAATPAASPGPDASRYARARTPPTASSTRRSPRRSTGG